MRNFIQDLRYAIRTMAKRPGFTVVAALTLALGIGANTAIFSAVNAVLLKPLPFPESEQLVDLSETFKPNGFGSVSVPNFEDWKNQNTVFTGITAYMFAGFNLEGGETPQRIQGMNVSANYFDLLGVKPILGRGFLPGEDVAGSQRVVVLSDELWRSRFAANSNVINQTIPLNGHKYTIIGVMPRSRCGCRFTDWRGVDDSQHTSHPRSRTWIKTPKPAHSTDLRGADYESRDPEHRARQEFEYYVVDRLRRRFAPVGIDRCLWRNELHRGATHTRDRNSDGIGGTTASDSKTGRWPWAGVGQRGSSDWCFGIVRADAVYGEHAVRRHADRSADVRGDCGAAWTGRATRLFDTGTTRHAS